MDANVGIIVSDVARLIRRDFNSRARSQGVTNPQWRVLSALSRMEGTSQGGLADFLEVEPITVGRMIDRMQEAELVVRQADPTDRRTWRLYLTPKAWQLIEKLKPVAQDMLDDALEGLTAAESQDLQRLLNRIRENLSQRSIAEK